MATDETQASRPQRGVATLRESDPKGPAQFAELLETKLASGEESNAAEGVDAQTEVVAERVDGLSDEDLKNLEETEERYAASRRATTAGGHSRLYE